MHVNDARDIRPFVATTRWVEALRRHDSPVVQEAGVYHYYAPGADKSRTLSGVTTIMSAHLVGRRKRGAPRFKRAGGSTNSRRTRGLQGRLSGFMRGSLVHRQVEDAVLLDAANFLRRHPEGMHPWARALFDAIAAMGWRPLAAEYIVHDLTLGAAFRIDVVAVDREGRLVVIETKTGYVGGAFEGDHHANRWRAPFLDALPRFPCSPRNQAIVQAMLGALLLARTLQLPSRAYKVYVAHIEHETVRIVNVPQRMLVDVGLPIYQYLAQCRADTSRGKEKTGRRR